MQNQNDDKIKKGFTLVELIIVITILVILATIAFVSFQNYTKDARDSNRLMSIKNIQNGLEGFQIKTGIYPEPENSINILAGTSTITKQGYFGESQSDIINIDKLPLDPLDGTKYIYSINARKNKYQLLSYLEANSQISFVNETYADDLSKRNIKSFGNKLGIVLNDNNDLITQSVDIVNSTGVYKVILDNTSSGTFIGTGLILSATNPTGSCKRILETGSKKDGIYKINPLGGDGFDVYCDMTTDGGGWTLVLKLKSGNNTELSGNKSIWSNDNLLNNSKCLNLDDGFNCRNDGYSKVSFNNIKISNSIGGKIIVNFNTYSPSVYYRVDKKQPFYGSLIGGGIDNLWYGINSCSNLGLLDKKYDYGFYVGDKSHANTNTTINGWTPGYGWMLAIIGYGNSETNGPSGYNTIGGIGAYSSVGTLTTSFSRHNHHQGNGCGLSGGWITNPQYNTKSIFLFIK